MNVENRIERNIGIDLLKAFACYLIVSIHTIDGTLGWFHRLIVVTTTIGIPIFVTTSGLFVLGKQQVTYRYVFSKIVRIHLVCLSWELLYSIALFLVKQTWRPFLMSFILDFFQKGLFFHFWYLGAIILLYLLSPMVHKLLRTNFRLYLLMTGCLGSLNISLDVAQFFVGEQFLLRLIQTLRLWTWLFYFMCGGAIFVLGKQKSQKTDKTLIGVGIAAYLLMVICLLCGRRFVFGNLIIEGYYGGFPVMLLVICCVCLFYRMPIPNSKLSKLANYNMGIYIVHPFVLSILGHFLPALTSGKLINLLFAPLVYLVSLGITMAIQKIPVLKYLVKM